MKANESGVFPYKGITDAFFKVMASSYYLIDNQKRRSAWTLDWIPSILHKSLPSINNNFTCSRFLIFNIFKEEELNNENY